MQSLYDKIKEEIASGDIRQALDLAEEALREAPDAYLLYLVGNAHAKAGHRREAMNAYRQAEALDPQGPAAEARQLMDNIMDFYCKDLYNP